MFAGVVAAQSNFLCKEPLNFRSVPANGNLSVPCPNTTTTDFTEGTFTLYRGLDVIYNVQHKCDSGKCVKTHNLSDVTLDINERDEIVGFIVSGDKVRNLTSYKCIATKTYPPPLQHLFAGGIVALKEGRSSACNTDNSTQQPHQRTIERAEIFLWMWITAVVLLSAYSLIVTILALVIWSKLKSADNQSDYMNTKPRPSRERRKKGIQNPIPRYV
ncbi:uncharacterized protein LOC125000611 isoform X2 [Mugil cephalus]|uniref:uncharacterized protein LOC125000611 isoform X2 n=1 Tax=Mugil cephalus TaxID=48193 RepID=UPI001FB743D4|nr:uncharacterized protein LOC125000611 isoform X2 [Mugil cephalus]